jgi:steroid 5-alpha reductase family enzyme
MSIWQLLLIGWGIIFVFMSLFWYVGKRMGNYAVVDVAWTMALWILAVVYAILGNGNIIHKVLILGMVSFWAFRLGGYLLFTRILGGHGEDQRYTAFRKDYGEDVDRKFFTNIFQFQGALDVVLSLPFLFACLNDSSSIEILEIAGLGVFLVGIVGEAIADRQLHNFKSDKANAGKNCEVGLWNYSRHPNYFFEFLVWVGYGLVGLASPNGYYGLISTLIMLVLLTKVSGVPLAEKYALEKRPEIYKEYQRTTSAFVPWFKKS